MHLRRNSRSWHRPCTRSGSATGRSTLGRRVARRITAGSRRRFLPRRRQRYRLSSRAGGSASIHRWRTSRRRPGVHGVPRWSPGACTCGPEAGSVHGPSDRGRRGVDNHARYARGTVPRPWGGGERRRPSRHCTARLLREPQASGLSGCRGRTGAARLPDAQARQVWTWHTWRTLSSPASAPFSSPIPTTRPG